MQRESDLLICITSMITDRIGLDEVLMKHKNYNFREKKTSQEKLREKAKNRPAVRHL